MKSWLRALFDGRPWWMNAMMVFCAYMTFVYVPWDLFVKPVAQDQEVWFGILFTGWAAKLLTPFHWAVYAAGAVGFRRMRSWMWPWASVYVGQIAVGMLVWSVLEGGGVGSWIAGVAAFAVFGGIASVLWRARPLFQPPPETLKKRYGDWALVTGASVGIGAEFARALAAEGLSLVLTARREDKLRGLADELEKAHSISTRIVAADLGQPDGADAVVDAVNDLEIAVLVNNAGAGYAGRFDKQDPERLRSMVNLNCTAPVVLTSRLVPGMVERGRGAVVIVGSVAGRQPLPLHGVYSATKAFDLLLGESLAVELRDQGIDVVVLEPGSTETEFQQVAGEIAHPGESAEKVVRVALDALGRQPSVVSGAVNWLRANVANRLLPRALVAHIARDVVAVQTPEEMR
jgi:short-subunit dehydrogenase